MAEADLQQWADKEFSQGYLEIADTLVVGRRRSLEFLKSFYRKLLESRKPNTALDLGCGDGIITRELLQVDDSLSAVLVDGSEDMLGQAREKLEAFTQCQFVQASFQELVSGEAELPDFDLAVSSLAIHHLTRTEKRGLFRYIFTHLVDGAYFINIDMVRAPSIPIEEWQMELWKEGVFVQDDSPQMKETFAKMVHQYTTEDHYRKVDTLESQMSALAEVGFRDVDCFYKRGMFAMFGGRK